MELYVHIPFCRKKCRYCSFTSHVGTETEYEEYTALLLKEAEDRKNEVSEPIRTVYLGGGTPSLLPAGIFSKLLAGLRDIFDFSQVTEFTSEANPGTVTGEWLHSAVNSGINRLSLGMQAKQDHILSLLGRIHRFEDVVLSVEMARKSGIGNISLDLIFGIPGQTVAEWRDTLDAALSLHPDHISAYGLIPEEGTPLYCDLEKRLLELPDPDDERLMYDEAISIFSDNGLYQYEISNFARKGFECRHNIGYWTQIPYIGLGVSAASMTDIAAGPNGISYTRRTNPDSGEHYRRMIINHFPPPSVQQITPAEARFEAMMLGLRMNDGIGEETFSRMHGMPVNQCFGNLEDLLHKGLLLHKDGRWKMTRRGFDIQNSILVELMENQLS